MLNQATEAKKNQDTIVTAPLNENKTIEIPKEKWTEFLKDLSKRRFGWQTKVEVMDESIGDQILSQGLILNSITHEDKTGNCTIEISLGEDTENHQTHTIIKPVKIAYLNESDTKVGVVEIVEANNTKTLISLMNPMQIVVGYAKVEMISVG